MYAVLTFLLVSMVSCQSLRRFESFRIATSLEHESFLTKSHARQLDPVVAAEDEQADPAIIKELIATNTESPSDDASTGTVNTAASCPTFDIPYNNQDNNQDNKLYSQYNKYNTVNNQYSITGIFGKYYSPWRSSTKLQVQSNDIKYAPNQAELASRNRGSAEWDYIQGTERGVFQISCNAAVAFGGVRAVTSPSPLFTAYQSTFADNWLSKISNKVYSLTNEYNLIHDYQSKNDAGQFEYDRSTINDCNDNSFVNIIHVKSVNSNNYVFVCRDIEDSHTSNLNIPCGQLLGYIGGSAENGTKGLYFNAVNSSTGIWKPGDTFQTAAIAQREMISMDLGIWGSYSPMRNHPSFNVTTLIINTTMMGDSRLISAYLTDYIFLLWNGSTFTGGACNQNIKTYTMIGIIFGSFCLFSCCIIWIQEAEKEKRRKKEANKKRTEDVASPLFIASQDGNVAKVKVLLKAGGNVNQARTTNGCTPLFIASQHGNVDTVKVLIKAGANVDHALTTTGVSPLFIASSRGNIDTLKVLIKAGSNVNQAKTTDGASPLYVASQKGNVDLVEVLLEAGGNVNQHTHKNTTPLNTASNNGHTEIVRLLLQQTNIDLNKQDKWNTTALGRATLKNHTEIIQLLKNAGAQ